jgi:hypothetical protein
MRAALGRFLREAFAKPAEARRRGQLAARHARQFWSWQNAATIAAQRLRELGADLTCRSVRTRGSTLPPQKRCPS